MRKVALNILYVWCGVGLLWLFLRIFDATTHTVVASDDEKFLYSSVNCPKPNFIEPDLTLAHITNSQGLPNGYVPESLVGISPYIRTQGWVCVTQETALALARMFSDADKANIHLEVFSGYRGADLQAAILARRRAIDANADFAVAMPYFSEHQTGTVVDITGASVAYQGAQNGFERTPEYAWLAQHAWEYGFNLSYPLTLKYGAAREFRYEPWHWRYLGIPIATELHDLGISYNELPELSGTTSSSTL